VGHLATCYGSEWVYYSIDGCLHPAASSATTLPAPSSTNAPTASSTSAVPVPHKINTGVVVGAAMSVVGCFVFGLVGARLLIMRRRKKTPAPPPAYELSAERALAESAAAEKQELWADGAAVEMGRNSGFEDSRPRVPVNPSIRIWTVA
jgi:hypothetical protein